MGLIRWIKKRRKEKLNDKSIPQKPYWVWWHKITKHAVKKMNERTISKGEVHENLTTKPLYKSKTKWDNLKRPSYRRVGKKITTAINPFKQNVITVYRTHSDIAKKYSNKRRRK